MATITLFIGFFVGAFLALVVSGRAYDKGKSDGVRLANEIIDNFIQQQEDKDGTEENE